MPDQPNDPAAIESYHAHIYYDPASTKPLAARLRDRIEQGFAPLRMGNWHDGAVGPHTVAMYQVAFGTDLFATLVPWLMLNHEGLSVLIHPNTDRPKDDHLLHALWLGERLKLNPDVLPETTQGH